MARKQRTSSYYLERQRAVEREGDLFTNIVQGMAEKSQAQDVLDKYGIEFAEPTEARAAPTSNPNRPRALKIAYMQESETLFIKFRDGTICAYAGIPRDMWQELKATDSTGRYIDSNWIYEHSYTKVHKFQFPAEVRVLFE